MMKRTHDGQRVYPAGSALPEGAHGFTQVRLASAGYSSWLAPEDCERASADIEAIRDDLAKLRTRGAAAAAIEALGGSLCGLERLADMKVCLTNLRYRALWPLVEVLTPAEHGARDARRFLDAYPGVNPTVQDVIDSWHMDHGSGEPPPAYCVAFTRTAEEWLAGGAA